MAEYVAKLHDDVRFSGESPTLRVEALTEFEACALAREAFRRRGVVFGPESGLEVLQGNVTSSKPVPVKEILFWWRNKPEGQALERRDGLQELLACVPD
jgi:hypothetical protein